MSKKAIPDAKLTHGVNMGHFEEMAHLFNADETVNVDGAAEMGADQFRVIRFMDWIKTNAFPEQPRAETIQDLPMPLTEWQYDGRAWSGFDGVPLPLIITFANMMQSSPWINIPHSLDEDGVRWMIEYAIGHAECMPIFEHSNETWNATFQQSRDLNEWGYGQGLSDNPHLAGLLLHAERTANIKKIVGNRGEVVLGAWFVNQWQASQMMSHIKDVDGSFDALAIAPYFGSGVDPLLSYGALVNQMEEQFEKIEEHSLNYGMLAEKFGTKVYWYECGQHMKARCTDAQRKLAQINRSPLMRDWMVRLADIGQAHGVDVMCWYSLASKWGVESWGLLDGDTHWRDSIKFEALI